MDKKQIAEGLKEILHGYPVILACTFDQEREKIILALAIDFIENDTTVERPQGEWVVQRLQGGFDDVYCPFCNARPTRSEYGYYLQDNFCHECGADMRKGGADKRGEEE